MVVQFGSPDQVSCHERAANAFRCNTSRVARIVEPPESIVVVQVMIWVLSPDPDRGIFVFSYGHCVRLVGSETHSARAQKKIALRDDLTCRRVLGFSCVKLHIIGPPW